MTKNEKRGFLRKIGFKENQLIQNKTQNFSRFAKELLFSYKKKRKMINQFFNPAENSINDVTLNIIPTSSIFQLLNFKHQNYSHFMESKKHIHNAHSSTQHVWQTKDKKVHCTRPSFIYSCSIATFDHTNFTVWVVWAGRGSKRKRLQMC